MRLDTTKSGLDSLFKPYQGMLLEHLWSLNENEEVPIGSGKAWLWLCGTPEKKSRASVIFYLNDMVDEGVLGFHDRTGKGGHHRLYYPKMDREQFAEYAADEIVKGLINTFPTNHVVLKTAIHRAIDRHRK